MIGCISEKELAIVSLVFVAVQNCVHFHTLELKVTFPYEQRAFKTANHKCLSLLWST